MVNMNNLLNGKDSRWLQLEVCREFQRNKCTRPDTECKFAHPPANVEVQNGRVTACYDSIKVNLTSVISSSRETASIDRPRSIDFLFPRERVVSPFFRRASPFLSSPTERRNTMTPNGIPRIAKQRYQRYYYRTK